MDEHITAVEFIGITAWIGSIVFAALLATSIAVLRKSLRLSWLATLATTVSTLVIAFVLTMALWLAVSAVDFPLPEPLFMIGGVINSLAVVASIAAFMATYTLAKRYAPAAG